MHTDPFAVLASDGLDERLMAVLRTLGSAMTQPTTLQNIHALLAYQNEPGVKAKFDLRFGQGAADKVIQAAARPDTMAAAVQQLGTLNERIEALERAINGATPSDFSGITAKVEALVQQVANMKPATVDIAPMAAAVASLAAEVKELKALTSAPRTIITDVNGDPVGIRIGTN